MIDLTAACGTMNNLTPSATLAISARAKEMTASGLDVCSMCAGEPDFDTPRAIKDACIKALNEGKVTYTPASGLPALRRLAAEKFSRENGIPCSFEQIVMSPGAKFSVFAAIAALCGPGDEVVIGYPCWLSYPEMVKCSGATLVPVVTRPENNFELDPDELEKAVTDRTRLLILNTPSNPTGAVYRRATLEKIAEIAVRRNFMVLSDEIYEKLAYDPAKPHVSIASLNAEIAARTVTVNGFSKTYAMTGWRMGYSCSPLWLAKRIIALQSHATSNPTTFAQYGAIAALEGKADDDVRGMIEAFKRRGKLIYELVSAIPGVRCTRPDGAFYLLCDVSSFGMSGTEFCEKMLEKTLLAAIPCEAFGAPGHIRFSYACSEENIRKAAGRLADFCASLR